MAGKKISAVDIKELNYVLFEDNTEVITEDLTGSALAALLKTAKKVLNVHQDTWTIEEDEPTITSYKNQLTEKTYRQRKEMGDVSMNFTIGQYDYATKADLMGGTSTETSWKRSRGVVDIYAVMIALTEDNQYCVFPKGSVVAREANTDNAVGIAVAATAMEPETEAVSSEYWFDASEVVASETSQASMMSEESASSYSGSKSSI